MTLKVPRKEMKEYTIHALKIIEKAAMGGLPAYAKRVSPEHLLIETRGGKRIYTVKVLFNPETLKPEYIALALGYDYGEAPLAKIVSPGEIGEEYPWNVPGAIAYDPEMMPQFQADVWSRRLQDLYRDGMRDQGRLEGYRILLSQRGDCVALLDTELEEVHAWINLLLHKTEYTIEWIEKWRKHGREWVERSLERARQISERIHAEGLKRLF